MEEEAAHFVVLKQEFLPTLVWTGFYNSNEVLEMVLEGLVHGSFSEPVEDFDEQLVERLVLEEFERKAEAEKEWPEETDCDRLTQAFEKLTSMGILSIENNAYTNTDGWAEWDSLADTIWIPSGKFEHIRGGCFYHGQDLEGAVAYNEMHLSFTARKAIRETEEPIVGRQICEVLREFGFSPEWDGNVDRRILLPIKWMRRYGPGANLDPSAYKYTSTH